MGYLRCSCYFDDIWLIKRNIPIENLELQYEEVADAKWATIDEINKLIDNDEFIKYKYMIKYSIY